MNIKQVQCQNSMKDYISCNPKITLRSGRIISVAELAVVRLYHLQTNEERMTASTVESNGIGFNAFDAKIGSSLAKSIIRKFTLSKQQILLCKKLATKYSKQLLVLKLNKDKRNESRNSNQRF